ncbi:unnamed protein product [Caenorhabditis auriculariae]|uniref:Copine-3 n=1 Tax=Caenorhabditis auriculariae TaxID=2777116 RepID=A0A8S1HH09_9PELO|nr:unnamed protein product [Caenorhabditis auriculariae]
MSFSVAPPSANVPSTNQPSSFVLLTIKANKLKDRDVFSKSDPICVVHELMGRTTTNEQWIERGRTEMIKNCLNPEFAQKIRLAYFFEERQFLRIELYDVDNSSQKLEQQDFLGCAEIELAEIVSSGGLTRKLTGMHGDCGTVTVSADEDDAGGAKEILQLRLRGEKLDKKDFFGKSDPFLNFYRRLDSGDRQLAHRTEVIKKTLNPEWKPFEISLQNLCGGDKSRQFQIECFDYDNDGGHDFIGSCQTTVEDVAMGRVYSLPLINEKKRVKKGSKYKDSGILHFISAHVVRQETFLDFISGGTQLDFAVAIDFTASNGQVHQPNSLHYFAPNQTNQYEVALRSVLEICQHYNSSKKFDAYGFGAKVRPSSAVSPVFNLNTTEQSPTVLGVGGVMAAYRAALQKVDLYGPTNFAPVIKEAAKRSARIGSTGARYQILLIITDGVISDMANTKRAIIEASGLPLSIIIVGVGNDAFESMDELDSDDRLLSHQGWTAQRDIVQFVPLRNFLSPTNAMQGKEADHAMAMLAKEVLAEVPLQLTSYMKSRSFKPRPPNDPWPRDPEPTPEQLAAAEGAHYPPQNQYPQNGGYGAPLPPPHQPIYPNPNQPYPQYPQNPSPYPPQSYQPYPPQNGQGYGPPGSFSPQTQHFHATPPTRQPPYPPTTQHDVLVQSAPSAPPVDMNDVNPYVQLGSQNPPYPSAGFQNDFSNISLR